MPCFSPLKGWKDERTGGIKFKGDGCAITMEVRCGQCLGCRLDHSRMWAMRCVHEASCHDVNAFLTLTYRSRDECTDSQAKLGWHVPSDWSLDHRHVQLFFKRLRKRYADFTIRYFMAGEYGRCCKHGVDVERVGCPLCPVGRPHYHVLLFGFWPSDAVVYAQTDSYPRFYSAELERLWRYGFVDVGEVNFKSAAYVARYCLKKVRGQAAEDFYWASDLDGVLTRLEPEYIRMSRGRPCAAHKSISFDCDFCEGGIGWHWFRKYWRDVFPSDEVPVPGEGVVYGVPRYYEDWFKVLDEVGLLEVKEKRQDKRLDNSEEFSGPRLYSKYRVKAAAIKSLKRSLA